MSKKFKGKRLLQDFLFDLIFLGSVRCKLVISYKISKFSTKFNTYPFCKCHTS
jgi:hypothetical protein